MGMHIRKKLSSGPRYPYMVAKEIFILRELLKRRSPLNCLEWGSGYSTIFYSGFLGKGGHWYSIEHDKKWFEEIGPQIKRLDNVKLALVEPNHQPWTDEHKDGSFEDVKDYILYPKEKLDLKFDFILIDGRGRKHCLEEAQELLRPEGIVVVHDANRPQYFEGHDKVWKHEHFLRDGQNDKGGLFIASDADIGAEMEEYKEVWATSERWEKKKGFGMAFK